MDFDAVYASVRSLLLKGFAETHSLALQQTMFQMGRLVLEAQPEIEEIRMSLPNKHHFAVDLQPFGLDNPNEVFFAADRPYGLIEAASSARGARPATRFGPPCRDSASPTAAGAPRTDPSGRNTMTIAITDQPPVAGAEKILTPEALAFVEELHRRFAGTRDELLAGRAEHRRAAAQSGRLDFLPETEHVRDRRLEVAPAPAALQDRRVEMTGPASPAKMAINALNSGAKVWLADLEDACAPTWHNVIDSQLNLYGAARGELSHTSAEGKEYRLRTDAPLATVVVRPRGWHLPEKHLLIDGAPAVGALVDFGLHFFHNAAHLASTGQGRSTTCPRWRAIWRRGSGTRCSPRRRTRWASRAGRCGPRC